MRDVKITIELYDMNKYTFPITFKKGIAPIKFKGEHVFLPNETGKYSFSFKIYEIKKIEME